MPQSLHLIEMGPGRGTLMQDILRIGEHQEGFIESLTVSCVEICPNLYEQQQQALSDYPFVFWYKNLSEVPKGADFTILIAQEMVVQLGTHGLGVGVILCILMLLLSILLIMVRLRVFKTTLEKTVQ